MKRRMRKGFTLVEILIVVVILGILAAIVIPQFTNASEEASVNSLRADLQTMRSQIELYKVQHLGQTPTVADFVTQMTGQTNINGAAGTDFGPYLERIPTNQFVNSNTVAAADAAGVGWVYNATTGRISAATTGYTGALVLSSY
ncbi:MAG: prepilin-type N-terminal cleavage/methylation domain-containing protein [Sedimentisphaerales bacterium]|nr:prepilin-type N-terminal cleavage/methylation domain-containing protein [Sedimentisphaerales bacterium]